MKSFLLLPLLLAVAPLNAALADDCANASSQTAMNLCADQAYKKTDADLNRVYQQIISRLKSDRRSTRLLVTAQKNWLAFRDTECAFVGSRSTGGSIQPMIITECRDGLTGRRVEQLKDYLHCEEGDLSCPVHAS